VGPDREAPPAWLEALQDVVYVLRVSPTFGFEFVSDSVTGLIGYSPQEHYDDPDLGARLIDPRDRHRLDAMAQTPPGARLDVTLRWIRRDGRAVWTHHRCIKQQRPDGSVVVIGSVRDVTEQVRDRQSLAAAREQYRLLAENASDVVFRATNDGVFEWVSDSVLDVTGWTPDQLTGRPFVDFVHPEDRQLVLRTQADLLGGVAGRFEARVHMSDRSWRWIAVTARPLFGDFSSVIGHVGGWRDIQAKVEAREALASSEALFRTAMEQSAIGVVLTTVDGRITTVNDAACAILRRRRTLLIGSSWATLVGTDPHRDPSEVITEVNQNPRQAVRFEERLEGPGHEEIWVDLSVLAILDAEGRVDQQMIHIYDITDRVRTQQQLKRSHEEYRLLAENAADLVILLDAENTVGWVSPSLERLTGYRVEDVLGHSALHFVHPLDIPRAQRALGRVFGGQMQSQTEEIRVRHGDGSYAWWQGTTRLAGPGAGSAVLALRNIESEIATRTMADTEQTRRAAVVQTMLDPHLLLTTIRGDEVIQDFRIVDANHAAVKVLGTPYERLIGSPLSVVAPAFQRYGLYRRFLKVLKTGQPLILDDATHHGDGGTEQRLDVRAVRVGDETFSITWRDVTERHQMLTELADSHARYRAILDSELEPHITLDAVRDADGHIVDYSFAQANRAALEYLGVTREQFEASSLRQMYPSAAADFLHQMYAHTVETGEPLVADDYAYPNEMFGGQTRYYDLRGVRLGDGLSLAWRDVTQRHEAAAKVALSERRYRLLAENATDVVFRLDSDGVFLFCSEGAQRVLGWLPDDLHGRRLADFLHPEDLESFERLRDEPRHAPISPVRLRLATVTGEFRWTELTGRRIGDGLALIAGMRDVTDEVRAMLALEQQARTDTLTGLPNRGEALRCLEGLLADASDLCVLFIDLDNLKDINDTSGHAAGDQAVCVAARRISSCLRDGDLVARIGGDEFLALLTGSTSVQAAAIAERIRAAVGRPFPSGSGEMVTTVSIGVAASSPDDTVDTLVARADRAMYAAKVSGRDRVASSAS
jgi:diguanylate cyclase (GGDEF)-like protein/PAS domain S-box-containing protein